MNAVLRDEYEAPVLTIEIVEVHLAYLHSGVDAVQAALPVLRDKLDLLSARVDSKLENTNAKIESIHEKLDAKIDAVQEKLDTRINALDEKLGARIDAFAENANARIDALDEKLGTRIGALAEKTSATIDAVNTSLSEKIDEANRQRAAGDTILGEKIDKLTERVLEVQGHQKAVLWVFSISTVIASLVSIARTLGWI